MGGTKKMMYVVFIALLLVVIVAHVLITRNLKKQLSYREKALDDATEIYLTNKKLLTEQLEKSKTDYSILFDRNCTRVREVADLTSNNQKLTSYIDLLKTDLKQAANFLKEFNEISLPSQSD